MFHREMAWAPADAVASLPQPLCDVFHPRAISGLTVKEVGRKRVLLSRPGDRGCFVLIRKILQTGWLNTRGVAVREAV
jgi:hypothetical protein